MNFLLIKQIKASVELREAEPLKLSEFLSKGRILLNLVLCILAYNKDQVKHLRFYSIPQNLFLKQQMVQRIHHQFQENMLVLEYYLFQNLLKLEGLCKLSCLCFLLYPKLESEKVSQVMQHIRQKHILKNQLDSLC